MKQHINNKKTKSQKRDSQTYTQIRPKTEESSSVLTHNYNPLEDVTCKIGDNACAAKHVSVIQRAGLFHPMNESQRIQSLLKLQQQYGNRFAQQVIAQHTIQAKLQIGQPGDIYEQAADRVVNPVMSMPGPDKTKNASVSGQVQGTEEQEQNGMIPVAQGGGSTPDGNSLGPTDPTKRCCLPPNRLIWVGGPGQNTATAAMGWSRVTANLGSSPADCDCGCGLFRQYVRGYWRRGSPSSPKQYTILSCRHRITMNETSWTEEHEACNPGGPPISASCKRTYTDQPGWGSGLSDGTYIEYHLDLRYQMWDHCRGRPVATGDRRLRISGDRHPRNITFS